MTENQLAIEKIEIEFSENTFSEKSPEMVVGHSIAEIIKKFCCESVTFSRKVLLSVPTICDCINKIVEPIKKERKTSVSDIEVYAAAVKFYSGTSNIKCVFEFTCTEETEEITEEQLSAVREEQEKIKAQAEKAKAEKEAQETAKAEARKAEREKIAANVSAKKETTTQQLSLFDL